MKHTTRTILNDLPYNPVVLWNRGVQTNDQTMIRDAFNRLGYQQIEQPTLDTSGYKQAIVVSKGAVEDLPNLMAQLALLDRVLFFVTSDEESLFPAHFIDHPHMRQWTMHPRRHKVLDSTRLLLTGYQPGITPVDPRTRDLDWFFAGQVTHQRRQECVAELRHMDGGLLLGTDGFMKGMPMQEYYETMCRAKVVPCPSGPNVQDTFRFVEALECGAIPLVDAACPIDYEPGYWEWFFQGDVPFPTVYNWMELPEVMAQTLRDWEPLNRNITQWWLDYKKSFINRIASDALWLVS